MSRRVTIVCNPQRVHRHHRRVGRGGGGDPEAREGAHAVGLADPPLAEVVDVGVAEVAQERRAGDRHRAEVADASQDAVVDDRAVLDAVAGVGTRGGCLRRFVGIEHEVDRGVADGVDADLETGLVGAAHLRLELVRRHHPETDIVRLPFVGRVHPRRAAADRAIAEELRRADAHPLVAEAGADAERDQFVERLVEHHHQVGADGQAPRFAQPLVGAQLARIADTGLGGAGDALPQELAAAGSSAAIMASSSGSGISARTAVERSSRAAPRSARRARPGRRAVVGIGGVAGDTGQASAAELATPMWWHMRMSTTG